MKWKGEMRTLFGGHMGRRRGDENSLIWIGRKVQLLGREVVGCFAWGQQMKPGFA